MVRRSEFTTEEIAVARRHEYGKRSVPYSAGRLATFLLGVALLSILTGCGPETARVGSSKSNAVGADASCTIHQAGSDVRVTFRAPSASKSCARAIQKWSGNGEYWARGNPEPTGALSETCALTSPQGSTSVIVEDSGTAIAGKAICGELVHAGWIQDENAPAVGPAEVQADAQASVDEAADALRGGVDNLRRESARAQSDWRAIEAALKSLRSNLPTILKDAAAAKASHCTTFPSIPDSPDIGADYLKERLRGIRDDIAQMQAYEAAYSQASHTANPTNTAPDAETVSAAITAAQKTVEALASKARRAQVMAKQIVNREEAAVSAAGC